jgi:glycosyl transferase family 25
MRVQVISLLRAPERIAHVDAVFGTAAITFDRVAAVDGQDLTSAEISRWRRGVPRFYEIPPAELACFLSHRGCWETVVRTGEPIAIFEDDVHLGKNAREILADKSWIPTGADIVKLDTTLTKTIVDRRPVISVHGRTAVRLRGYHTGGAGYVLTERGARKLLDAIRTISDPFDQLLYNPALPLHGQLEIYQLVPALCIQHDVLHRSSLDLPSYLEGGRGRLKRTAVAKLMREIQRPVERLSIALRGATLNLTGMRRWGPIPFE